MAKAVMEAKAAVDLVSPALSRPEEKPAPAPEPPRKSWRFVNNKSWWQELALRDGSKLKFPSQEFVTEDATLAAQLTELVAKGILCDGN